MDITQHIVNLDLPPRERWQFLKAYTNEMNELFHCYLKNAYGNDFFYEAVEQYKQLVIPHEYQEEIRAVADVCNFNENEVLVGNLYYDVLKFFIGCTAFATHNGETMLHSRNLDWPTDDNLLSRHSMIFDFQKGGQTVFKTVSWPGFIGALSGTSPGRFSITLNAVVSLDKPELAYPVTFLLRDVLTSARSYHWAKTILEETVIASDCLLLLSGVNPGEHVVIERTPKRHATRESRENFIIVTNDYKQLENGLAENILRETSCSRYDRAQELLRKRESISRTDCFGILKDPELHMEITVQQMVFDNVTGAVNVIKT